MKQLIYRENYEELSQSTCDIMLETIIENPHAVIVLATGHSPQRGYRYLVNKVKTEHIDVSNVTFVKLDEWLGVACSDESTCEYFLQKELIEPLGIKESHYLHFNTEAEDAYKECTRIEKAYDSLEKVDLIILGIGMNGHLGLNEPASTLIGVAHVVELDVKTKTHEMLSHTQKKVEQGVTLGLINLFKGNRILLLADGENKKESFKYLFNDEITTAVPVSLLKLHQNVTCIINKESI